MKSVFFNVLLFFVFTSFSFSQNDVKIGSQVWMSKNLDVSTFRNGDLIPQAKTSSEWNTAISQKKPAWCYYNFDLENGKLYGKLYNWYAVNDSRLLAPVGYHIPSNQEWDVLINFLGGSHIAGGKLKSTFGWTNDGNGSNESGFNAFPGSSYGGNDRFIGLGVSGHWWSSSTKVEYEDIFQIFVLTIFNFEADIRSELTYPEFSGLSVRCIKD